MMLVLKVPIAALLYLVWWASRSPEASEPEQRDWTPRHPHDHLRPRKPRPPRRGPHAEPEPRPPKRVRSLKGRKLTISH